MREQTKNILVGLFVISACCLVASLILFLQPSIGDGKKTLHIRFSNITKLNVGTRVLYAGRPIGEVVEITPLTNAREQPTDPMGRLYFYDLTLKLDSSVQVFSFDQVCVQTAGLLGEKSIAIIPKPAPKGMTPQEITSTPIYADSIDPVENAFHDLSQVACSLDSTLKEVNYWIKDFGNDTGRAIQNFSGTMKQLNVALKQLHEQKTFLNASALVENLKTITQKLSIGEGSVGKLLNEDNVYLKADAILSKTDTLLNDVNHYGLLFHMNKGWQRMRTKRMNTFASATSPSDYTDLFVSELGEINTAMSRLKLITDKIQTENLAIGNWADNKVFIQEFSLLFDRAKALADHLKQFNEQLMDSQKPLR